MNLRAVPTRRASRRGHGESDPMRPEFGFYESSEEICFVDRAGAVWRVHVHGAGPRSAPHRMHALPASARALHASLVEERLWEQVSHHPHITMERPGRVRAGRRELAFDAASSFWDLIGEEPEGGA